MADNGNNGNGHNSTLDDTVKVYKELDDLIRPGGITSDFSNKEKQGIFHKMLTPHSDEDYRANMPLLDFPTRLDSHLFTDCLRFLKDNGAPYGWLIDRAWGETSANDGKKKSNRVAQVQGSIGTTTFLTNESKRTQSKSKSDSPIGR